MLEQLHNKGVIFVKKDLADEKIKNISTFDSLQEKIRDKISQREEKADIYNLNAEKNK